MCQDRPNAILAEIPGQYIVMAYGVNAYVVMTYVVMTYVVMAYVVMAHVVMIYVVMAYVVMIYVVMALYSYGPRRFSPATRRGLISRRLGQTSWSSDTHSEPLACHIIFLLDDPGRTHANSSQRTF